MGGVQPAEPASASPKRTDEPSQNPAKKIVTTQALLEAQASLSAHPAWHACQTHLFPNVAALSEGLESSRNSHLQSRARSWGLGTALARLGQSAGAVAHLLGVAASCSVAASDPPRANSRRLGANDMPVDPTLDCNMLHL